MPKAGQRRTKSAPKFPWRVGALSLVLAGGVLLAVLVVNGRSANAYNLRLMNGTYSLEAATTEAEQEKGLGGRTSMPANHGMLFVFGGDKKQCFWMKDMSFPLDMIWADSTKRVTHIEHDLSPLTFPAQYCAQGKYVIELNAGTAVKSGLRDGTKLDF